MKKIFFISISLFIYTSFISLNAQWARTYGGDNIDIAHSIQQTSDGGYIVAGRSASFGNENPHFWLLKLSSTGDVEWQRSYGSRNNEASSIQQTSDGGYIVAGRIYCIRDEGSDDEWRDYDFWVLKLSSAGDIEWQNTYGDYDNELVSSIQQTSDGGYIVAGKTYCIRNEGTEDEWRDYDFWVLKLSSVGDIEWQRTYGEIENEIAHSIQQTSDGGYIVAGYKTSFSTEWDDYDFWVLKLSSAGDVEWQRAYGGSDKEKAYSVQQTNDGGYIVAGYATSFGAGGDDYDFWVLKLSSAGDIEWQRACGGSEIDIARSIQQTGDGGYIVAGSTTPFSGAGAFFLLIKLSSAGDIEWQRTYGDSGNDEAYSIRQTIDGGYIVAGSTTSYGAGETDFLVLKLSTDGDIDSSCEILRSSNVSTLSTSVSPEDTNITPQDTDITPFATIVTGQDTDAIIWQLCPAQNYTLNISSNVGGTTNPLPGNYTCTPSVRVTIKAISSDGYVFKSWTGEVPSDHENDNPLTVMMDDDKSIGASFSEIKEDGPCFIATVAYGSSLHPYVKTLQDFRNKYLVSNKLGRELVALYYKYSPSLADLIIKHKALKVVVRINLFPLVVCSYSMIHFGPIVNAFFLAFIIILSIFFAISHREKLKK